MNCSPRHGMLLSLALIPTLFLTSAASADDIWTEDVAAAIETAKSEQRDLLFLYTGSDWCKPCMQLEAEVFSEEDFAKDVADKFVLVKLDFPQTTEQPEAIAQQNQHWADRFGVDQFPTVLLMDWDQKPYAFTGYREGGVGAYLQHLTELKQVREKRDAAFAAANDLEGRERAQKLDEGLSALDIEIAELYYEDIINEIGELDKDDNVGLRTKYFAAKDREMRKAVMSDINMVARLRQPEDAIKFIDARLAETKLPVDMWLEAQRIKVRLLRLLKDHEQAEALLNQMIGVDGITSDTRQRLIIKKVFFKVGSGQIDVAVEELQNYIDNSPENLLLLVAKGELLDSMNRFEEAIETYDQSITAASSEPEILMDLVGAKADALYELDRVDEAVTALDALIDDQNIPAKMRAEALLHKALILRESGRRRAAMLAENRAVETVETPEEKGEIQKLVDQFRRKFASQDDGGN